MACQQALLCTVLLVLGSFANALSVNLLSPHEMDKWVAGQKVEIAWELPDRNDKIQGLNIALYKGKIGGGVIMEQISKGLPATIFKIEWHVDSTLEEGNDYYLVFSSSGSSSDSFRGPHFTVSQKVTGAEKAANASSRASTISCWLAAVASIMGMAIGY